MKWIKPPAPTVLYMDAQGVERNARQLSEPDEDGRSFLLISFAKNGRTEISTVRARYSEGREPATWRSPPKPS